MSTKEELDYRMMHRGENSQVRAIAEAKVTDPMNTWPPHNDYHRKNTHPFSGSKYGELYWDEDCLRCQLEYVASQKAKEKSNESRTDLERAATPKRKRS